MYPSVAFGFHTQGYVKKGRRLLSDAPFGRFSEALACRRPRIRGEILLSFFIKFSFSFLLKFLSKNVSFGRSLAQLILDQNGTSLAMYLSVGYAFQAQGYVSKGRRFLSDAPLVGFPNPWPAAFRKLVPDFFP